MFVDVLFKYKSDEYPDLCIYKSQMNVFDGIIRCNKTSCILYLFLKYKSPHSMPILYNNFFVRL